MKKEETKKYEMVYPKVFFRTKRTLYRVKALRDFGAVRKGDIGGYIESERNLSHDGNCWIYDNAKVIGSARVKDDAKVFDWVVLANGAVIDRNYKIAGNKRINSRFWIF